MNPTCIKPIHSIQIHILSRITDAHDGIRLDVLRQTKEFCQGGLSGGAGADAHPACAQALFHGLQEDIFCAGAQILSTQLGQAPFNPERGLLFQHHDSQRCSLQSPSAGTQLLHSGQDLTVIYHHKLPGLTIDAAEGPHGGPEQAFHLFSFTFWSRKLRIDFLFAIASIIVFPPTPF